jgi:hypothetical protein
MELKLAVIPNCCLSRTEPEKTALFQIKRIPPEAPNDGI